MKSILFLATVLALVHLGNAQVKTNFKNVDRITANGKFAKNYGPDNPYVIPARDINALLQKEISENADGQPRPFKIAEAIKVDIDVTSQAHWIQEADFAYGKFSIVAASARSISINFDRFYLPPGTELYVYSENGEMITGPITETENNSNNFWGSWVYKGGRVTVDFKTPATTKSSLKLHISSLGYGYKDIYRTQVADFGASAVCEINVICPLGLGWENERNSVALILDANSQALCSGALVNNTCNFNNPFFLTANHCFQGQNVAQWKFTFQAISANCNPSQNSNGVTFNGSTFRANSAGSDFCLVELNQAPPSNSGITYAGWTRDPNGIQEATIIHHPMGDVMKITNDTGAPGVSVFGGADCWHLNVDNGTTEPGSSGAPYFDQNHRIFAQHFGIDDGFLPICDQVSKHGGRFNVSWAGDGTNATRLSNWLDPGNTGAMTVDTRNIPFITTSTNPVCTDAQFTLNNPPPGTTWQSSNTNVLTIDPNTGYASRVGNENVAVTISAVNACGAVASINVWVGLPSADISTLIYPQGMRGIDPVTLNTSSSYRFVCDPVSGNVTSYTWVLPSGFSFVSGSTTSSPRINTSSIAGSYILYCQVNNSCGGAWTHDLGIDLQSGGCIPPCPGPSGTDFSVYPNPTSGDLTVSIADSASLDQSGNTLDQSYGLFIVDRFGQKVFSIQSNEAKIAVPVSNLPSDIYYLNLIYKEAVLKKAVVIKR